MSSAVETKAKLESQCTGMMGVLLLNLGLKTGAWDHLRGGQATTARQLAERSGLSERYLEELLRAAALHGYLDYTPGASSPLLPLPWDSGVPRPEGEAFSLPQQLEEVLYDEDSPAYYGHTLLMPLLMAGPSFDSLVKAFHTDSGVPYSLYAEGKFGDFVEKSHGRIYRTQTKDWMAKPELAEIREKLEKGGVVLDLGCGSASSSLAMAREFPQSTVHAVDCDEASMEKARANILAAVERGELSEGQVVPHCCFAHEAAIAPGSVDLVLIFISLHDMHNPSEVLASAQQLLRPGGSVLVLEFTAPDSFSSLMEPKASTQQRGISTFCYSASVLHCLPVSKVGQPSQAVGTQFSLPTMQVVAAKAGFTKVSSTRANDMWTMFIVQR